MFDAVEVPLALVAALAAGCLWGLVLGPFLRRRRARTTAEVLRKARLSSPPPAFQRLGRTAAADLVLDDPRVREAVLRSAVEKERSQAEAFAEARSYALGMSPSLNVGLYLRLVRGPVRSFLERWFRIRVEYADEAAIRKAMRGVAPVFVMNHRSNLDYVIAATSLSDHAIVSCIVGEWARYWPLESLVRSLGGTFVRRGSNNPLYRAVLAGRVRASVRAGMAQAFFAEGRLSEDGRLGKPKLGMLDYAVRSLDPEGGRDIALVPVSVNYDRVPEDANLQYLKARGWTPTRFRSWWASLGFVAQQVWLRLGRRWRPFGAATVRVGAPLSLRAWLQSRGFAAGPVDRETRSARVTALAAEMMRRIAEDMPVLPVPLMAAVIRRGPKDGVPLPTARDTALRILERLGARRGAFDIPPADRVAAIELGIRLLIQRRFVANRNDRLHILEARRPFLDYYANTIGHLLPDDSFAPSVS